MFRRIVKLSPWVILPVLLLGFAIQASVLQAPSSGSWAPVPGTLAEATSGAASALLPDGRILVTGGAGPTASAEFFNLDGSFSSAPAMAFARQGHTAVTLQDGRVLVSGGTTAGDAMTDTAEIYDPATNAWTTTGLLIVPRSGHTATLLQDGRVLVAGGENSGGASNTVEVFNSVSGTSSLTAGVLSSARVQHAAAALPDGRVLIVGGSDGTSSLASTDVFDPSTNFVAPGPALGAPRQGLSATTLLDGTVLIAGGSTTAPDGSAQDLASAEIFNYSTGTFTPAVSSLATARSGHLAFLLPHNNSVLIVGGTSAGSAVASAELYRPWTGEFSATGSMASARASASGGSPAGLDGVLVVAGGCSAGVPTGGTSCETPLASAEAYGFATIMTDKDDYAPGEIVTITGSGWQPGETVSLLLHESNNPNPHPDRTITAVADAFGNILDNSFSPEAHDVGIRFYLTATGSASQAQTTFTDSQPISVSLSPASKSVAPGGSAVWTSGVTVAHGGNNNACSITLSVTTLLPTGAVASFDAPNPFTMTSADVVKTLTISTTPATPPGTYPFTLAAARGTGCQGTGSETTSGTLIVFGAADHLAFVQQPTNTAAGASITPAPTVEVRDSNNNLVANSSALITLAIGNNPGGGTLSGTVIHNAVNGVATFSGLSINKVGTGYTLTASGAPTGATSSLFNITLGPASQLVFTTQPGGANAGDPLSPQPQVSVEDAFGNVITTGPGSGVNIALSFTPATGAAGAALTCTTNPLEASSGVATFAGCSINLAGTGYRLRASTIIGGNPFSADSNLFDIASADSTPPTTTIALNPAAPNGNNNWYTQDVHVTVSAADNVGGSGVKETRCVLDPLSPPTTFDDIPAGCAYSGAGADVTTEDQHTVYAASEDNNNNKEAPVVSASFKIDKTKPTNVAVSADRLPDHNGWYNHAFTATWTGDDATSGIDACTVTNYSGPDTGSGSISGTCTDNAGNVSDSVNFTFMYDATAPTGVSGAPDRAPDHNTWYNHAVNVVFTGTDATSGIDSCTTVNYSSPDGASRTVNGTCTDNAGNTSAPVASSAFDYDSTPPDITITAPADGASYILNASVASNYGCTDATSGVDTCSGPVASGTNFSTSPVGSHSFTVNALDNAGNTNSKTVTYSVQYNVCLLYDQTRAVKSGATYPIKVYACDASGADVSSPSIVLHATSVSVYLAGLAGPLDDAGNANPDFDFRFDATLGPSGGYIFNLKTKGYSTGTYLLHFTISGEVSGTDHTAGFGVK